MKKTVVIYKSKYGNTRFYAEWIARKLNCDVYELSGFNKNRLREYSTVIFGGGLYGGKINGISFVRNNFSRIDKKRLIVFTVGLENPQMPETVAKLGKVIETTFDREMISLISFFHFRGGIDYRHLGPIHEFTLYLMKRKLDKKEIEYEEMTNEEKLLFDTYGKRMDFSDRDAIEPLLKHLRNDY